MRWLSEFYKDNSKDNALPEDFQMGVPVHLIEQAKRVLSILEAVEWKWTPIQILEQPAELLDAVLSLKTNGEKVRRQLQEQNKAGL